MEIQNIPIDKVKPSPLNPRKTFDEEALKELAQNIANQGLLQPITVRPITQSGVCAPEVMADTAVEYEVVCGERRYRASLLNGAETIACIVRDMNDDQAFDAMITENLQRKDVDPIEEAYAFGQLAEKGSTAEEIANRFGKSIRFVQDRIKLNSLIPELLLLVKEGKMAISAGLIICKLDEAGQQKFYGAYGNYESIGKDMAQRYVETLFMMIERSPWYSTDNEEDEDFEGGCGCKCSACHLNTANANCLFWEMKTQDAGKCTSRDKFEGKMLAFLLDFLKRRGDIVKVGEALEYGKTVIIDTGRYWSTDDQRFHDWAVDAFHEAGYEVVKPDIFGTPCYYSADDERIPQMHKDGKIYRCVDVFWGSHSLNPRICYYYIKTSEESGNAASGTVAPTEVSKLTAKYIRNQEIARDSLAKEMAKMAAEMEIPTDPSPLTDAEKMALYCFFLDGSGKDMKAKVHEALNLPSTQWSLVPRDIVAMANNAIGDKKAFRTMAREFLRNQMGSTNYVDSLAAMVSKSLLREWLPDKVAEVEKSSIEALEAKQSKIADKLKDLGYGTDGKPLEFKDTTHYTEQ
ncbi:MAG: ParB/RepB/Spo0J family partition protein [Bacteroidales bacterium]|nr:ParB/RepB/Spo0J family partition protein [Bacteroidales bacterium]